MLTDKTQGKTEVNRAVHENLHQADATSLCAGSRVAEQTPLMPYAKNSLVETTTSASGQVEVTFYQQLKPEKPDEALRIRVGDCIKQRFELLEVLGVGGMGVVFRALDLRQKELGEESPYVALKVLSPQLSHNEAALMTLQKECKRTQQLSHPNIVNVYDFDRDQERDLIFFTMELLHGKPLDELILTDNFAGLAYQKTLLWIREIGAALSFAHQRHIVHSDLKPSNLFLDDNTGIKVFDFGIARALHEGEESDKQYLKALTPAYASLGMLTAKPPQETDDLYAFAIVIYLLLTGRHPYDRKTATEVIDQCLVPARPGDIPEKAWKILRQALDPLAGQSLSVEQFLYAFLPQKRQRLKPLLMASSLPIVVALLLTSWWGWQYYQETEWCQRLISHSPESVNQQLAEFERLPQSQRAQILLKSRKAMVANASKYLASLQRQGELHRAKQYLAQLLRLFPDSQKLFDMQLMLEQHRQARLQLIEQQLKPLSLNWLQLSSEQLQQWFEGIVELSKLDPSHDLLEPQSLSRKISTQIHRQLYANQLSLAKKLYQQAKRLPIQWSVPVSAEVGAPLPPLQQMADLLSRYQNKGSPMILSLPESKTLSLMPATRELIQSFRDLPDSNEQDQQAFLNRLSHLDPGLADALKHALNW